MPFGAFGPSVTSLLRGKNETVTSPVRSRGCRVTQHPSALWEVQTPATSEVCFSIHRAVSRKETAAVSRRRSYEIW
jgi:hypothetical protein